ncbi:MAG: peptidase family [Bacteroidetes bacterium]|nr:peptidase family [Bacteroidota bacterium]
MKPTFKLLVLLIAAGIAYSLESFTCDKTAAKGDSSLFKTKEGEKRYLEAYSKSLALWPVKYSEVDLKTSFGKAHVIISGPERGNPLVLLHGMNASSTMWYPNVKELSATNRIYAIDFIAEPGKSVLRKDIKTNEDLVKWYDEVFEKLHLKKMDIVAASRGGWIALQLAMHSRKKINHIVLLSPAQSFIQVKPKKSVLKNFFFSMRPERKNLRSTLKTLSYNVDKLEAPFVEQYYLCQENMKMDAGFLKMDVYSDKELQSLKMPVMVLIGDHDIFNNSKSTDRAKELISNVETAIIKRSGHFVSFDQPVIVDEQILTFLQKKTVI